MQSELTHEPFFANLEEALAWADAEIASGKRAKAEAAKRAERERQAEREERASYIIELINYRGELGDSDWCSTSAGGYWRDSEPEQKRGEAFVAQNREGAWVASVRPLVEREDPVYIGAFDSAVAAIAAVLRVDDEGAPLVVGWEKTGAREFQRRFRSGVWYVKQANSGRWYFCMAYGDISEFYQTAEQAMGVAEAMAKR